MKNKWIALLAIVGISLCLIWWGNQRSNTKLFEVMPVPEFTFINQDNEVVSNKDLLGKVYVVEFFFTNCPSICPIMNRNLMEVNAEINHPDFGVVAITIDPKRDSVETLKRYKNQLAINNDNWHFLTGDKETIYALSERFNIYVGEASETEGIEHSGKMALVDKNGMIRSRFGKNKLPILYYSGLNYDQAENGKESLTGKFHPEIDWLKEDILILMKE